MLWTASIKRSGTVAALAEARNRLLHPLELLRQRLRRYSLRNLAGSYILRALSLWHMYLAWVAACVYMTVGVTQVLHLWIAWYVEGLSSPRSSPYHGLAFIMVMCKCWIWITVLAEVVCFCFIWGRDAGRVDGFEAYRRALLGESRVEVEEGSLYISGWQQRSLRCWTLNLLLQAAIYISLDVMPLIFIAIGSRSYTSPGMWILSAALRVVPAACIHIVLFYLAWSGMDLAVKWTEFWEAWRTTRDEDDDDEDEEERRERSDEEAPQEAHLPVQRTSSEGASSSFSSSLSTSTQEPEEVLPAVEREDRFVVAQVTEHSHEGLVQSIRTSGIGSSGKYSSRKQTRFSVASTKMDYGGSQVSALASSYAQYQGPSSLSTRLNLCVYLCRGCIICEAILPHVLCFAAIVVGLRKQISALVIGGLATACFALCYAGSLLLSSLDCTSRRCRWSEAARWEALQAWGERCCGLGFSAQRAARETPALNLAVIAFLFGHCGYWAHLAVCAGILGLMAVMQSAINFQRPFGWLVGIAESMFLFVLTVVLTLALQTSHAGAGVLWVVVLSLPRQFGLRRPMWDGGTVKHVATFWMCTVQLGTVFIVLKTVAQGGQTKRFSKFCDTLLPGCSNNQTLVPFVDVKTTSEWPQCAVRWQRGGQDDLSLADFGLLSSLAYESEATINGALQAYFPGWRIEDRHITTTPENVTSKALDPMDLTGMGWTTFYEFVAEDGTTVFSVRGTQYLIDVLMDIDIWMPAATLQLLEKVGSALFDGYVNAVNFLTQTGRRKAERQAFGILLDRIVEQMRRHPHRQFYITGHSLGGGIAKLVAADVHELHPELRLPAVVFSAPGVSVTSQVMYGEVPRRKASLARTALNVKPANDIVSQIDVQSSAVIPVACQGGPLQCHDIFNTLCSIYEACGSMRTNATVVLPFKCRSNI